MAVKIFSLKIDGGKNLSANFKVKEFKCNDTPQSDMVKIDDTLILLLQKIRDHFGVAVTINSAFRTEAHNAKVGGSPNSQHMLGTAADIVVKGITPLAVAQYAESLGAGGIGHYPAGQGGFTHIDTRAGKSRWERRNGKDVAVAGFGGKSFSQQVQEAAKLEAQTMSYLQKYKYAEALFYKLAEAIYKKAGKNCAIVGNNAVRVQASAGLDDNTMDYLQQYTYADALLDKLANAMK